MRRLGQHFLLDPSILKRIIDVSGIIENDLVVEIGPGYGRLTRLIAEKVKHVIAIEIDSGLIQRLRRDLNDLSNVEIVYLDALKYHYDNIGPFKVVSNIPYYITTPLIFRLLKSKNLISMTLTVQKEVAQRIAAQPGSKSYGVLSIMVQYMAKPEIKFFIPRGAFRPVPKVDSAVIHIELFHKHPARAKDEELFKRIVKIAFSNRRKTILNSLKVLSPDIKSVLQASQIDPARRPETLGIEDFIKIADLLSRRCFNQSPEGSNLFQD